ncbi:MAG: hypothetical protein NT016_01380 [Candidatus Aenigmarchaeota archaeon]|nr:hypothetical protein [Candidatus Aenigmarchaeota archaeon]
MLVLGNSRREILERKRIGKYLLLVFLPLFVVSFIAIVLTYKSGGSDVEAAAMGLFALSIIPLVIGVSFYWNVVPTAGYPFGFDGTVPWGTKYDLPKWADRLIYIAVVFLALLIASLWTYSFLFANK